MSWSNLEAVEYLLKDEKVFWENYCSSQTKIPLAKNDIAEGSKSFSSFYRIVKRLAELMPNLDHNSPGYSWSKKELPLITFGKKNGNSMNQNNTVGAIFIWENKILLGGSPAFVSESSELDWNLNHAWRGVKDGRAVFKTPVDLESDEIPNEHPLHDNHRLVEALKRFSATLPK